MQTERAQEVKADYEERLKGLAELTNEAQQSAQFIAYLKTAAKFHKYSPLNIWLILFQKPSASHVAGYNRWKELKRQVRKGEHGIAILAPCGFASYHTEPNPLLLIAPVIIRESVASSNIENINTTLADVLQWQLFPEDEQRQPDKEVLRYREAMNWGFNNYNKYALICLPFAVYSHCAPVSLMK